MMEGYVRVLALLPFLAWSVHSQVPNCGLRPIPRRPAKYIQLVNGNPVPMDCAPGTNFEIKTCSCSLYVGLSASSNRGDTFGGVGSPRRASSPAGVSIRLPPGGGPVILRPGGPPPPSRNIVRQGIRLPPGGGPVIHRPNGPPPPSRNIVRQGSRPPPMITPQRRPDAANGERPLVLSSLRSELNAQKSPPSGGWRLDNTKPIAIRPKPPSRQSNPPRRTLPFKVVPKHQNKPILNRQQANRPRPPLVRATQPPRGNAPRINVPKLHKPTQPSWTGASSSNRDVVTEGGSLLVNGSEPPSVVSQLESATVIESPVVLTNQDPSWLRNIPRNQRTPLVLASLRAHEMSTVTPPSSNTHTDPATKPFTSSRRILGPFRPQQSNLKTVENIIADTSSAGSHSVGSHLMSAMIKQSHVQQNTSESTAEEFVLDPPNPGDRVFLAAVFNEQVVDHTGKVLPDSDVATLLVLDSNNRTITSDSESLFPKELITRLIRQHSMQNPVQSTDPKQATVIHDTSSASGTPFSWTASKGLGPPVGEIRADNSPT